jgi:nitrate reductase NapAB chaperone NapD
MQNNQQLNEGLRSDDLKNMITPIFSIDTFKSKMGEDRDVCVMSIVANDRAPAKDLMEFVEKGYNFVLDADISSGEDDKGQYHVFIELPRTPRLAEQIKELKYGIEKLTGITEFKFVYHKQNVEHDLTEETLRNVIPNTPASYDGLLSRMKTEGVKEFFNKTLMDDLTLDGDVITIHKPFNQKIQLRWLNTEEDTQPVIEETIAIDPVSSAETFWLTKVLGDYDINKFGDKFLFTNDGKAMLFQRIQ